MIAASNPIAIRVFTTDIPTSFQSVGSLAMNRTNSQVELALNLPNFGALFVLHFQNRLRLRVARLRIAGGFP